MNITSRLFVSFAFLLLFSCQSVEREPSANGQNFTTNPVSAASDTTILQRDKEAAIVESKHAPMTVWVCKSAGAKKFHFNQNCGGLGRCKHKIEKMDLNAAESVGLSQCSFKKCR